MSETKRARTETETGADEEPKFDYQLVVMVINKEPFDDNGIVRYIHIGELYGTVEKAVDGFKKVSLLEDFPYYEEMNEFKGDDAEKLDSYLRECTKNVGGYDYHKVIVKKFKR